MNKEKILLKDAMPLEWDERKYGTGFAHLDRQHRELFDGVNGLILFLEHSSATEDAANQDKVIEMLYFLGEYAMKHFRDEEEIFARCGHLAAAANKEAHQTFLGNFFEYNDKLVKGVFSRDLLMQLHIFLRSWLINHIVKIDTALRECAEKESASHRTEENIGVFSRFLSWFQGSRS